MTVIRRYLAIIQDPRGYPAEGLDPAPPNGPEQPMVFSVVKADEHDAAIRGAVRLLNAVDQAASDLENGAAPAFVARALRIAYVDAAGGQ